MATQVRRPVFDPVIREGAGDGEGGGYGVDRGRRRSHEDLLTFLTTHLGTMLFDGRTWAEVCDYISYGPDFHGQQAAMTPLPYGWRRLCCYVVTGNSEGYYVHLDMVSPYDDPHLSDQADAGCHRPLALVKTFQTWDVAHAIAGAIGELVGV